MDIELFGLSLSFDSEVGEFTLRPMGKRSVCVELLGGPSLVLIFLASDDQTVIVSPYGGISVTVNGEVVRRAVLVDGARITIQNESLVAIIT